MEAVSACQRQESLVHLLIAAAGSGRRMGADRNKLLLPLRGRCVLAWTLDAALASQAISWIGVVGQEVDRVAIMDIAEGVDKPLHWIQGGSTRQESVQRGLAGLPDGAEHVLIHDGARCLAEPELFDRCAAAVSKGNAVIAATPVTDTIKRVNADGVITDTPDRSELWAAQTPQGFTVEQLRRGHLEAERQGWSVTDDASLYERLGWDAGARCRPLQHQGDHAFRPDRGRCGPCAQVSRLSRPLSPSRTALAPIGSAALPQTWPTGRSITRGT